MGLGRELGRGVTEQVAVPLRGFLAQSSYRIGGGVQSRLRHMLQHVAVHLESGVAVELTHSYCRSDYYDFVAELRRVA